MSQWVEILTAAQIEARFQMTAKLDPRFARDQKHFYETRTLAQLDAHAHQSWLCNEADSYQLARSFRALKEAAR